MPMNRATLELFADARPRAPDAAARPARGRDLRRDHRRRRCARATRLPGLARAGRGAATSRAAWSARRTRRSPPRAGSRSATAAPRSSARVAAAARRRCRRRRVDRPARRASAGAAARPDARRAPDLVALPARARGRRRCGGRSPRCRTPRSTTATRAATTSCGRARRVPRAGARRRRVAGRARGHERLHAGAVADVPGAGGARRDGGSRSRTRRSTTRGRRSARPGWRSSACRSTSTASRVDALDADAVLVTPAHQFPTGAVLAPGAAARAARVGRDRDRGRLRLRVPLRPRAGRDAAAARARPRRLPRHGVEDARARAAARLDASRPPELAAAIAAERWAVDSGGPAIAARAYARLLATGEVDRHLRRTRREYRERRDRARRALAERLPECRVDGRRRRAAPAAAAPAGHGRGTPWSPRWRSAAIRIRGLAGYRLTPRPTTPRSSSATAAWPSRRSSRRSRRWPPLSGDPAPHRPEQPRRQQRLASRPSGAAPRR